MTGANDLAIDLAIRPAGAISSIDKSSRHTSCVDEQPIHSKLISNGS